jgi:type IV secretory pathway VirB3-like protein
MQVALTHAQLYKKVVCVLLGFGVGVVGRVARSTQLAMLDNVVLNVHLVQPPVHRRDHHDQRLLHVPLARAQEPQQQRIWVVVLEHAPESSAQLLGRGVGDCGLEVLVLAKLVVVG